MKSTATRVRKGIKLLDAKGPRDWRAKIQIDDVDMWKVNVLDQIYGPYTRGEKAHYTGFMKAMHKLNLSPDDMIKYGFCVPTANTDTAAGELKAIDDHAILAAEWKRQLLTSRWSLQYWFDYFFRLEEIKSGDHCPPYMYRWTLFRGFGCALYLHHFVGDDGARDLHDHPRAFTSIGLWGRYTEETPYISEVFGDEQPGLVTRKQYRAPWIRTFPPEHKHRLTIFHNESCWTLAFVWPLKRDWGFWVNGKFVPWRQYVYKDGNQDRDC